MMVSGKKSIKTDKRTAVPGKGLTSTERIGGTYPLAWTAAPTDVLVG